MGEIHFGINPKGEIGGQCASYTALREISHSISVNFQLKIYPKMEQVAFYDKCCIKVEFDVNEISYFVYSRVYIRAGSAIRSFSASEIENILLRKNQENIRWDNQICEKAIIKEIDESKVKEYLKKAEW